MGRIEEGSRDLAVASVAALLSLGLMAVPFGGLPKALALVPLVLLLPGYALAAAFFPPRSLPPLERLLYSVALSVGAISLTGLAWQFAFGLSRFAWACLLTAVVLIACAVARRRRVVTATPRGKRDGLPRLDAPTALAALVAVAIAVVAVAMATDGLQAQRAESQFSALWAMTTGPAHDRVEIGVLNHQGAVHEYRIEVRDRDMPVWEWRGHLGARQRKEAILGRARIPSGAQLIVSLYKDGAIYRRTELQLGTGR